MKKWILANLFLACACLGMPVGGERAAAQKPEVIVEIDKRQIYEGESVLYQVTLNHIENPTAPKLEGFDQFQITTLDERSLDSQRITIINGRRSEIIRRGRQYHYRLTPLRSGDLTIPAPTVKVGTDPLRGREIALRVIPPKNQDTVILELAVDRPTVYPMQPLTLTLTIAIQGLPGELSPRDPLSVQPKPPVLNVPWLDDDQIPEGIEVEKSWREILEPLVSRHGKGVQINNIGNSSVFSLFQRDATAFHPQPQRVLRKNRDGVETDYWEYVFRRTLVPRKVGPYEFGPVTLKGTFATDTQKGQLVGESLFAVAKSVSVSVRDVPLEGRPDSYTGAVGSFSLHAELVPASVRVGDPMTLTLTLSGQGNLADARPPNIASMPGVEGAFRTYEATEESQAGARRFTYSLRPLHSDVSEFPAVGVSYFDVEQNRYVTLHTKPLPVTVDEADALSGSEIVAAPGSTGKRASELQTSEEGLFANDSDWKSLRNEAVHPGRWLAIWSGMIGCWAILNFILRKVHQFRTDPFLIRRRAAPSRARTALKDATAQIDSGDHRAACETMRRAVTGLVADFANVPEGGLTPRDAEERLRILGVDGELHRTTRQFLDQCDARKYGAASEDAPQLARDAHAVVKHLTLALRKRRPDCKAISLLLTALLLLGGCGKRADVERLRRFQEAEQTYAKADSPDGFIRAASQYQAILNTGFVSGAILYNQGNAWMRAGETGRAIASYRQAKRYRPGDPHLDANLRNALAETKGVAQNRGTPNTRLAGYILFWQSWLNYPAKFLVTTLLLLVTLLSALLMHWQPHRTLFRRLGFGGLLLLILSGMSAAWDWHRFEQTVHGVVIAEEVTARKGDSENYEPAFTEPLLEGTEFTVVERRGHWLHILVGDSSTAWISENDVVVY